MVRNWARIIFAVVFFISSPAGAQDFPVRAGPGSGISFSTNGNNVRGRWDQSGTLQCYNDLSLREPGGPDFVTISSPALSSGWNLILPVDPGLSGECWKSSGGGTNYWGPCSGGAITLNDSNIFVGNASNVATGVAMSGDATIANTGAVTIANNAVTGAKFRQSAGVSVVGNSTNATANVADIVASTDHHVLRRSGTSLGFGLLTDNNIDASAAIARSKIAAGSANHVIINDGSGLFSSEATLAVTRGGIQKSSWTLGTLLLGNGTSAPTELSGSASGHVVQWNGSAWVSAAPPSSGLDIFGSIGSPRSIVAGTGITSGAGHMDAASQSQKIYVAGSGGPVNITANPQIEAGTIDGQEILICGNDDTNTVQVDNGDGLVMNGSAVLQQHNCVKYSWNTSAWVEIHRNF